MKRPALAIIFGCLAVATITTVWWKLDHASGGSASPKVLPAATSPSSRNAIRKADLEAIGSALNAYLVDHHKLPITISRNDTVICSSTSVNCKRAKLVDLTFLSGNGYLPSIPVDPIGGHDQYGSGYTISKDAATGKFRLVAPRTEGQPPITIEK